MKILLALTFVFGVLHLLTMTKLFDTSLEGILLAVIPHKKTSGWYGVLTLLSVWFFYFSLVFQTWYWLFGGKV